MYQKNKWEGRTLFGGRINDGMFRTVDEMQQDLGDDKIILLKGDASRQNVITFETV